MKKLIALLVVIALFIPTAMVSAATKNTTDPTANTKLVEFRNSIQGKRDQIKANRDNNQQLREAIKAKREQVKSIIEKLKQNKKTSKDKLALLKTQTGALKTTRQELKALHGTVKAEFIQFKENKANGKFEEASASLGNIIKIQQQRYQILTKLNTQLDELLNQLR